MKYLAHSAKGGCPPQAYAVHVEGVQTLAKRYAQEAGAYAKTDGEQLLNIVDHTSEAHDIGKLTRGAIEKRRQTPRKVVLSRCNHHKTQGEDQNVGVCPRRV